MATLTEAEKILLRRWVARKAQETGTEIRWVKACLHDVGQAIEDIVDGATFESAVSNAIDGASTAYGISFTNTEKQWLLAFVMKLKCSRDTAGMMTRYNRVFASYFGGSGWEMARDVDIDADGYIYVVGGGQVGGLPYDYQIYGSVPGGYPAPNDGDVDVFVLKLSPTGQKMWVTRVGGGYYDRAYGVRVGQDGGIYVCGRAGPGFPTTAGAFQEDFDGGDCGIYGYQNGFVFRLNADGQSLDWASYVGVGDLCRSLDLDDNDNVYLNTSYVAGRSTPPSAWFTKGYLSSTQGGDDCGILKASPDGSAVRWATWIGGSLDDGTPASVAWSPHDRSVWIGVFTHSDDLETTAGCAMSGKPSSTSNISTWIGRLSDPDVTGQDQELLAGTYFGGSDGDDYGCSTHNLAIDSNGNGYLTAGVGSNDLDGTPGVFQESDPSANQYSPYVAKFSADCALLLGTYVSGNNSAAFTNVDGVAVDSAGRVYVAGETTDGTFPYSGNGYQKSKAGGSDGLLFVLSPDFADVEYGTFYGGASEDKFRSMARDENNGDIVAVGTSNGDGFPLLNAMQGSYGGGTSDVVVMKFGG